MSLSVAPSGSPSPSPSPSPSASAHTGVGLALTLSGAVHYKLSRGVSGGPLRVTRDRAHHIVKVTARWSVRGVKGGTATITFSLTKTKRGWIGTITVVDRRAHVVVTLKPTGTVSARGSTLRGTGTGAVKVHGVPTTVTLHWSITTGVALPHVRFE